MKIIVVGAGHAGIESAIACAKLGIETVLLTGTEIAALPCNPSIGGPAKGGVVREIDALGGMMGIFADKGQIQMKMLNSSKGPAMRALRAQVDKHKYPNIVKEYIKTVKNLTLLNAYVERLIIEDNKIKGVTLENREVILSDVVILTTGTYLNSRILIGKEISHQGPGNSRTTVGISNQLKELGFEVIRLKTGTPPRVDKNSINYQEMTIQNGDSEIYNFSFREHTPRYEVQVPCYLTHTSIETREIILDNLDKSAMYGGIVEGTGPRYCPSIEDKIVRFKDKLIHQIFVEPEGLDDECMYIQGLSTSMPRDIQEKILHSVKGLEKAIIRKYAYAIEYDAINPIQLKPTLETKLIENLYCAGQINGTSGYEEAAGQGLLAGINAALKLKGFKELVLLRDEAYIGVLIDDLVNKGTKEPYRLLTSRAEHRLLLRNDNADLRLSKYGYEVGLLSKEAYDEVVNKDMEIKVLIELTKNTIVPANSIIKDIVIKERTSAYELIKRPEISIRDLVSFLDIKESINFINVDIAIKYEGYIDKTIKAANKMKRLEAKKIPTNIDYNKVQNISSEAREKLNKVRPATIGQASRILGVNPADIVILLIYIER